MIHVQEALYLYNAVKTSLIASVALFVINNQGQRKQFQANPSSMESRVMQGIRGLWAKKPYRAKYWSLGKLDSLGSNLKAVYNEKMTWLIL